MQKGRTNSKASDYDKEMPNSQTSDRPTRKWQMPQAETQTTGATINNKSKFTRMLGDPLD